MCSFNPKQLLEETLHTEEVTSQKTRHNGLIKDPQGAQGHVERWNGTYSGRESKHRKNCMVHVGLTPPN